MDWRAGHLTTTEGTGDGHLPPRNARRAGNLNNFFKWPGYAPPVFSGEGCSQLELTRTSRTGLLTEFCLIVVLNIRFNYGHEVQRELATCK